MAENEKSQNRLDIINKIKIYESNGWFDRDVEDDPPTKPLMPNKVDYLNKKLISKIKNKISNRAAIKFFDKQIAMGNLVIKEIRGIENFNSLQGGAFLTCNHFNPFDNYAIFKCIQKQLGKRNLYNIIREGNYTNFPGIFGFFFRNCNTLPLSSNLDTMKLFYEAVETLLKRGEKILIYPEQAMWWNYRKPRPLKSGAFRFAVKNKVPVLPCFITMQDANRIGSDGFPIQEYTVHFLKPIYSKDNLSMKENIEYMKDTNYEMWKNIYEEVYGEKLVY